MSKKPNVEEGPLTLTPDSLNQKAEKILSKKISIIDSLELEKLESQERIAELEIENTHLMNKQKTIAEENMKLSLLLKTKDSEISALEQKIRKIEALNKYQLLENEKLKNKFNQAKSDLKKISKLFNGLEKGIRKILSSKRWKIGSSIGELQRRLLFRKEVPMPDQYIEEMLQQYNKYKNKS